MSDPFSELDKTLRLIISVEEARTHKPFLPNANLRKVSEDYRASSTKDNFKQLVRNLTAALKLFQTPIDKKYFSSLKDLLNLLSEKHEIPKVNLDHVLSSSKTPLRFLSTTLQVADLMSWLEAKEQKTATQLQENLLDVLIAYGETPGFNEQMRQKISAKDSPNFLVNLINSKQDFSKILDSRLVFHLTDEQIAEAIIKYFPKQFQENQDQVTHMEKQKQVTELTKILSTSGRSVSALLKILNQSEFKENQIKESKRPIKDLPQPLPDPKPRSK